MKEYQKHKIKENERLKIGDRVTVSTPKGNKIGHVASKIDWKSHNIDIDFGGYTEPHLYYKVKKI